MILTFYYLQMKRFTNNKLKSHQFWLALLISEKDYIEHLGSG